MRVKVVKWCRKKWNEHNLMYIYHKQCEIKQKIQWNSSNGQLHWFPIDFLWKWSIMDQNYANANAFFSDWNIFLRYPGYAIWKLTSRAFWKCGGFCCYNLLNHCYGCSKMGPHWRKKFFQRRRNKKLTLSSYGKLRLETNNSGSKMFSNKNHHIFRKTWTSAFRWHILDTS